MLSNTGIENTRHKYSIECHYLSQLYLSRQIYALRISLILVKILQKYISTQMKIINKQKQKCCLSVSSVCLATRQPGVFWFRPHREHLLTPQRPQRTFNQRIWHANARQRFPNTFVLLMYLYVGLEISTQNLGLNQRFEHLSLNLKKLVARKIF